VIQEGWLPQNRLRVSIRVTEMFDQA